MATVREVLRTNLEAAKQQVEFFGFTPGKIKIKALGGGKYRCWCKRGEGLNDWESIVPSENAFDGDLMEELMVSFIESFDSIEPDLVNERWGSYHDYSFVAGEDTDMLAEAIETIDCRMKNYDEHELDMFWSFDAVELKPTAFPHLPL
jgi:hypothetical protein